MSSVDAISTKGLGFSAISALDTDKESETVDNFSAILQQMQTGGGAGSGSSSDSDDDTATVTQILPDGSVLVTVYQGDEVISQTKMRSTLHEDTTQPLGGEVGTVDTATQNIATGSAAALMLNALTQN